MPDITTLPPQSQPVQPGREHQMEPRPDFQPRTAGAGRLEGRTALITGGDSGIGRAVAVAMAREGAAISFIYLNEERDAEETWELLRSEGARALPIRGDIRDETFCENAVTACARELGTPGILVNNAAEQHVCETPLEIPADQLLRTFSTNVFGMFFITRFALRQMSEGNCIINTASVTAYKGNPDLIDYAASKGAIVSFTRSLSLALANRNIRVNAVAPGPIWTPLIPASFDAEKVSRFGGNTPLKRPGQPGEVAGCYVFLASDEATYITGQVLHPNGGTIVNS